ncbi:MAG: hypothetical protein A2283_15220 [Lentisphaerae bacterium RIFOXYA12_FULL_48_11]|nr:MAG: hypothetical protein A2283_15220 [Lentisphaerae bacterium RIFOXYA12_FULL_48_11]
MVENCIINGNFSDAASGGAIYCNGGGTVRNCIISGNLLMNGSGGGIYCNNGGSIENCTIVNNTSLMGYGGGVVGGTIINSIIYGNSAFLSNGNNYYTNGIASSLSFCCTMPLADGANNTTNNPLFLDGNYRLLPSSPCIDSGTNLAWMVGAKDVYGHDRIIKNNVDIGAYEAGELICDFSADKQVVFCPSPITFTAVTGGTNLSNLYYTWNFNTDKTDVVSGPNLALVTNQYTSVKKSFTVSLMVSNSTGESFSRIREDYITVGASNVYVSPTGGNLYPFTNWNDAANDIATALTPTLDGATIFVADSHYYITSSISVASCITIQSMNGPSQTIIDGCNSNQCFSLSNTGAVLDGFMIINGATNEDGGGIYINQGGIVQNCVISSNAASMGGGVYMMQGGVVRNCRIIGNSAVRYGGGIFCHEGGLIENCLITENLSAECGGGVNSDFFSGTIANCTIVSNTAASGWGGGIWAYHHQGIIQNSIIYFNNPGGTNNYSNSSTDEAIYKNCCTFPTALGTNSITNDPSFVSASSGNFHLSSNSMCINAGRNDSTLSVKDLDGSNRIQASVIDIGAYESPYAPIDASAYAHGSITPMGRIGIPVSSDISFVMTNSTGYPSIRDIKIDGTSIGPTNDYTFFSVTSNHTIEAIFWVYPDTNGYRIISSDIMGSSNLVFNWMATNGWSYTLQQTPTLIPVVWSNVVPYTNMTGLGEMVITNNIDTNATMFYRLKAVE